LLGLFLGCTEDLSEDIDEIPTQLEDDSQIEKEPPPARMEWSSAGLLVVRGSMVFRVDPETMSLVESTNTSKMVPTVTRPAGEPKRSASSRSIYPPTLLTTSHGLFLVRKGALLKLDPSSLELKDSLSLLKQGGKSEPPVDKPTKRGAKTSAAPILAGDDEGIYLFAGSQLRAINPQTMDLVVELKPGLKGDREKGKTVTMSSGSVAMLTTPESVFLLDGATLWKLARPGLEIEGRLDLLDKKNASEAEAVSEPPAVVEYGDRGHRREVYRAGGPRSLQEVQVEDIESDYRTAPAMAVGSFQTGQDADIVLSSLGFEKAGGALLFNHPAGIATNGRALAVADRNNNRVLVWKTAPTSNRAPDIVLGQTDFFRSSPGSGPGQMNWPISVEFGGDRLIVADVYNHRLLGWNELPSKSGTPADLVIEGLSSSGTPTWVPGGGVVKADRFVWPWGLWSDGEKLVLSSTATSEVLIWNHFPRTGYERPDLVLNSPSLGTPRSITSDGQTLMVGDHNARFKGEVGGRNSGLWVWNRFPESNASPDFFIRSGEHSPIWLQGLITKDRTLLLTDRNIKRWDELPTSAHEGPDLIVSAVDGDFRSGDGIDMVQVGERIYIVDPNGNKVIGFNHIPSSTRARPDFVIGAEVSTEDSLQANFLHTNPEIATDGRGLFSLSSFDRTLYYWESRPDESSAAPDHVYHFAEQLQDLAVQGDRLVVAGLMHNIYVWDQLPTDGQGPDRAVHGRIGTIALDGIESIAMDEEYFYLLDQDGLLSVWEGIPVDGQKPRVQVQAEKGKLSTDGKTLVIAGRGVWSVSVQALLGGARLKKATIWGVSSQHHPALTADVDGQRLALADRDLNRVLIWSDIEKALRGARPDAILGADDALDTGPSIGRASLFWPDRVALDGGYIWVGEYKFSGRIMRFSAQETPQNAGHR
jgi:hypothetical protein